jgi:hypothetical protein
MNRVPRPIYGAPCKRGACEPAISPIVGLTTFLSIVSTLEDLVRDFFNPTAVMFPFSATMSVGAYIPVSIGVRIIWKYENPDVYFDRTDNIHRLQIRAIYLAMDREADWKKDVLYSLSGDLG